MAQLPGLFLSQGQKRDAENAKNAEDAEGEREAKRLRGLEEELSQRSVRERMDDESLSEILKALLEGVEFYDLDMIVGPWCPGVGKAHTMCKPGYENHYHWMELAKRLGLDAPVGDASWRKSFFDLAIALERHAERPGRPGVPAQTGVPDMLRWYGHMLAERANPRFKKQAANPKRPWLQRCADEWSQRVDVSRLRFLPESKLALEAVHNQHALRFLARSSEEYQRIDEELNERATALFSKLVRDTLEAGADVHRVQLLEVMIASRFSRGKFEKDAIGVLDLLFGHGADVNRMWEGDALLHEIAMVKSYNGFLPTVLRQPNVDVDIRSRADWRANLTPLAVAVASQNEEAVRLLLEKGASVAKIPDALLADATPEIRDMLRV